MAEPSTDLEIFVKEQAAIKVLPDRNDDLFKVLRIAGDDCDEFLDAFASRFGVDMTNLLWYFHHGEEGLNLGRLIIKAPDQRVKRIPVTLGLLQEAIDRQVWPVDYPPHTLPRRRWDIWFNPLISVVFWIVSATVIIWAFKWISGLSRQFFQTHPAG